MSPRPRFTSKIGKARNAVLGVALRPLRWFPPTIQFVIGFALLVGIPPPLLSHTPLDFNRNLIGLVVLVIAGYLIVWRFVEHRSSSVTLAIPTRRAFALAGVSMMVQTAVVRLGVTVADGIAAKSTSAPLNDPAIWSLAIPFAAASL